MSWRRCKGVGPFHQADWWQCPWPQSTPPAPAHSCHLLCVCQSHIPLAGQGTVKATHLCHNSSLKQASLHKTIIRTISTTNNHVWLVSEHWSGLLWFLHLTTAIRQTCSVWFWILVFGDTCAIFLSCILFFQKKVLYGIPFVHIPLRNHTCWKRNSWEIRNIIQEFKCQCWELASATAMWPLKPSTCSMQI